MGRYALSLLVLLLAFPTASLARVWRVARDGTGDFTTIQPAVDAAASGDTVLIGPGRYREMQPFTPGGVWWAPTCAGVSVAELTLIGTHRDSVVIGPDTRPPGLSLGIGTSTAVTRLVVRSLTVVNLDSGIYTMAETDIADCAVRGCDVGFDAMCAGELRVRDCLAEDNYFGVLPYRPTTRYMVENCTFRRNSFGVAVSYVQEGVIRGCRFEGGAVGVQFAALARGSVEACTFRDAASSSVVAWDWAAITVRNNDVRGGQSNLDANSSAQVDGSGNQWRGGSYATVWLSGGTASLSGDHILDGGRRIVELSTFLTEPPVTIDLRSNYWGIANRDSIAALIWDGHDDPAIRAFVDFEPFSSIPLPAERKSLGSVKSLYKR